MNDAGVLQREESLGDDDVEQRGEAEGRERDQEHESLPVEYPVEHVAVDLDHPFEAFATVTLKRIFVRFGLRLQKLGAGHRHQRQ